MKKFLFLGIGAVVVTMLSYMIPTTKPVTAGKVFSTDYGWLDDAESTSLVQDTFGTTTAGGLKLGRIDWIKDYTSLTVAVKRVYVATPVADTCTAMWDNLSTDTMGVDVWTGNDDMSYTKKVYTYKYFNDSSWKSFVIPSDSGLLSNCFFVIRSWVKDSSAACAVTGTDKGVRYNATIQAWGK